MGRVWAARQVGSPLQRLVAVKTAISGQSQTPEFQRLFMDEARIASLIHHPHVCGVYELGEEQGTLYLVMEWCDGSSLRQVMDKAPGGRIALPVSARIIANVAAGLHAAHELEDSDGTKLRVVHRDVSPQNILISKNGHVKVADFGVAKAQGQLHRPTETGEMKGKLAYMAPEQVTAKDIDHRADIFALGCVLYEVTVGRRPFQGEGALSTLYQLLEQNVASPSEIIDGFPVELSAIILKALAKDANDRYQTAEDLRVALESWIASSGSNASEREIAALLKSTVGAEIDEKSKKIYDASNRLKEDGPAPVDTESGNSRPTSPTPNSPRREGAITVDRGVAAGSVREKSSWWMPVGAGLAVLGVVVVLARGTLGSVPPPTAPTTTVTGVARPSSQPVDPPPVEREPRQQQQAPTVAEPRPVKITLRTLPSNAVLRIDDGAPLAAPYIVEVAPSSQQHVITASAPNYAVLTSQVTFDQSREIVLELEQKTRQQTRRGRTQASAEPAVTSTPNSAPVPPKAHEAPPAPGKRPRTLDEANPFAG
jgi:serine/threonine protein kinase